MAEGNIEVLATVAGVVTGLLVAAFALLGLMRREDARQAKALRDLKTDITTEIDKTKTDLLTHIGEIRKDIRELRPPPPSHEMANSLMMALTRREGQK